MECDEDIYNDSSDIETWLPGSNQAPICHVTVTVRSDYHRCLFSSSTTTLTATNKPSLRTRLYIYSTSF